MLAWMDEEALRRTRESGEAWFWSRSRQEYWHKGATSGNTMAVVEIRDDCDGDAILLRVDPAGPACHTGAESCFAPWLWRVVAERAATRPEGSYVVSLLESGVAAAAQKVGEEGVEVALAGGRRPRRAPRRGARRPLVPQLRPARSARPRSRARRGGAEAPPRRLIRRVWRPAASHAPPNRRNAAAFRRGSAPRTPAPLAALTRAAGASGGGWQWTSRRRSHRRR